MVCTPYLQLMLTQTMLPVLFPSNPFPIQNQQLWLGTLNLHGDPPVLWWFHAVMVTIFMMPRRHHVIAGKHKKIQLHRMAATSCDI